LDQCDQTLILVGRNGEVVVLVVYCGGVVLGVDLGEFGGGGNLFGGGGFVLFGLFFLHSLSDYIHYTSLRYKHKPFK
jgi:hypothetical protein